MSRFPRPGLVLFRAVLAGLVAHRGRFLLGFPGPEPGDRVPESCACAPGRWRLVLQVENNLKEFVRLSIRRFHTQQGTGGPPGN